ncbi:LytR/AlgR family response regulator transcription factor [Roseivirga misakiensis]|uniref:DNA-binding response regulator n=1 Tax=Roseivirga misakiensis TaxID=1563681 RepID=A0A1E5SZ34_9BACT|nr:LytTR family DNA-binding domain-containing protein [Roseivirga misakiensis]OEK04381.1 DNA-binding response regulator [Roseivirga misakiensis]
MRVVIIEDEAPAFRRLQKILEELIPDVEILEVLDSVESAVEWLDESINLDLIFMDIQLSDGLSFEIFEKTSVNAPVIFTTAFDEYLLKAFKVNGIDYLLKPIKTQELAQSLAKLNQLKSIFAKENSLDLKDLLSSINMRKKDYKSRFLVKQGSKLISIPVDQIAYFFIKGGVQFIYTFNNERLILDQTMDETVKQLDPKLFYRANRQYLIHIDFIGSVEKYFKGKLLVKTKFSTEEPITVSEEKASSFKAWLND